MPPKLQLLAVVAFAVAMLFLENQIQKLEESRAKLGEALVERVGMAGHSKWASAEVSEGPGSWDQGTSSSPHQGGKRSDELQARGLRPEGCPVGPPRREGTQVCMGLVLLEDTNAHPPREPSSVRRRGLEFE